MDETKNNSQTEETIQFQYEPKTPDANSVFNSPLNSDTMRCFFRFAGGSPLYCLSAVFVAYGIVTLLAPVLEASDSLRQALPCLLTLHGYELSLLAVLVFIVSRKVVDDAISIVILTALFLIGTSVATGSAINKDIHTGYVIAIVSIIIAAVKILTMRRFAGLSFRAWAICGILGMVACNYLGPIFLAQSITLYPEQEDPRKVIWLAVYLGILLSAGLVLVEAASPNVPSQKDTSPLLRRPVMVYLFAAILAAASGVHLYTMEYAFALVRVWGDFLPVVAIVSLLGLEIARHTGRRSVSMETAIALIPLAATLWAIYERVIGSTGQFGLGWIAYPPVLMAVCGAVVAGLAYLHRWQHLYFAAAAYGLGVILTAGYSIQHPHDLNTLAFGATLTTILLMYGIYIRNPHVCLTAVFVLCIGLLFSERFGAMAAGQHLTRGGSVMGLFGGACILCYLLWDQQLNKHLRILGTLCLAAFLFDCLPYPFHWRYLAVFSAAIILFGLIWLQNKDIVVIGLLCLPLLLRLYIASKSIAAWRAIILGFALLAGGAVLSLWKNRQKQLQ